MTPERNPCRDVHEHDEGDHNEDREAQLGEHCPGEFLESSAQGEFGGALDHDQRLEAVARHPRRVQLLSRGVCEGCERDHATRRDGASTRRRCRCLSIFC